MNTEEFLRSQIRKILTEKASENEDSGRNRIRSVGVGKGGWKGRIKEAGALAKEDPAKLMSNLKIKRAKSKTGTLDTLKDLLEQAANGTEEMKSVYTIPAETPTAKNKDGESLESVVLNVSTITPRDAIKYIEHTIVGATKAFGVNWNKEIEITKSGNSVVVYLK